MDKELKLLFDAVILLVESGKVLALCPCRAYLSLEELCALKCSSCGKDINFEEVFVRSIENLPKA